VAAEIVMKRAKSKSESPPVRAGLESESQEAVRAATLEDIVRLIGKDPLVAFAEAACGILECTGCNGAGIIERDPMQLKLFGGPERELCARCQGSKREKASVTAMLDARYKLAKFFYAPLKAVETRGPEGQQQQHVVTVEFVGRDEDEERERG
jgi:hypothetical protein